MNKRYFQWLSGSDIGKVVEFDKVEQEDDMTFLTFSDKSRCNVEYIAPINETNPVGKYMVEVSDPNNIWHFTEKKVGGQEERWEKDRDGVLRCVAPYIEGKIIKTPIPPKRVSDDILKTLGIQDNNTTSEVDDTIQDAIQSNSVDVDKEDIIEIDGKQIVVDDVNKKQVTPPPTQLTSASPVYILVKNAKKVETDVEIVVKMTLPQKSLYEMIISNFPDDADVFYDTILEELTPEKIKSALKESLIKNYNISEYF